MCHSLLYSVKEGRSICLGHSPFLFVASRHPLHMHLQGFGSQGCKDISEVVFAVRCDVVEEEPVLQGMPKDGERVVYIFWVTVIDGQADGCSSSCQCASNDVTCGLGRLGDQLLQGRFWGHVSVSDSQIRKNRGRTQKWLYLGNCQSNWAQTFIGPSWGCLLCCGALSMVSRSQWHHKGANGDVASWKWEHSHFHAHIITQIDKWHGKILPFVFPSGLPVFDMNVQSCITVIQLFPFLCTKQCSKEPRVLYSSLPPWFIMKRVNCGWRQQFNTEKYLHSMLHEIVMPCVYKKQETSAFYRPITGKPREQFLKWMIV